MEKNPGDVATWRPTGPLGQGYTNSQTLRDPFLSPTEEDPQDYRSRQREVNAQYGSSSWRYQRSEKEDYDEFDTGSLTVYSPTATSLRKRSTFYEVPPPKPSNSFAIPHPFPERYETPPLYLLLLHTFFCAITYPALYFTALIATGRSLFWARVLVGAGCGIVGFSLGITILELAQAQLEASTWATLIHQSNADNADDAGIRLKDLCVQANEPKSVMSAVMLLWNRRKHYRGTRTRNKGYYEYVCGGAQLFNLAHWSSGRSWTGYILLFIFSVFLSGCLSFIFGRTVDIATISQMQNEIFEEVLVGADLSPADLQKAAELETTFTVDTLFTWTLEPFSVHGGLPTPLALTWNNETVYFAEVIQSQLQPNGSGFGTFETDSLVPKNNPVVTTEKHNINSGLAPGAVLSFPRWGLRIHCELVPDLSTNLIPFSTGERTYLFTPRATVQKLFDHFGLSFPSTLDGPLNVTKAMVGNDTFPPGLDPASLSLSAAFWSNGVSLSTKSTAVSRGEEGRGFVTLENVLVRLNDKYAPHSTFAYYNAEPTVNADGTTSRIGYDAAVCLELYEPWIVNVYNTSFGPPTTMSIQSKVDLTTMDPQLPPPSKKSKTITNPNAIRMFNSSALRSAYVVAHGNGVNQVVKDNGRDMFYVPSPTLISFTNGSGPRGYTEFSTERYQKARAITDASNVLPYFAGSGQLVARRYEDKVISIVTLNQFDLIAALILIFVTGLICAIFIPRLPLGVPRRGFNLYSWILAFHAKEIEVAGDENIVHGMTLDQLQDHAGEAILRYRVVSKPRDKLAKSVDEPEEYLSFVFIASLN
ncbi:hypothetical protein CVT24_012601 [Panaeolus cyanescens]|uniref:Uncharacterized protein n=1 Tax=Panaeolus cyanescens TaxID=181874 RepID=A0A409YJZ5_9AGAR|nr:hypothetical protein CVT24_012601 [Panaeolus cyanescens]